MGSSNKSGYNRSNGVPVYIQCVVVVVDLAYLARLKDFEEDFEWVCQEINTKYPARASKLKFDILKKYNIDILCKSEN